MIKYCNPKNTDFSSYKLLITGISYAKITITDNGIGFDKQFSEKIFEVFQRLHSKQEYIGTGIGLAIVKKIVQNHNGFISAHGEPDIGAVFQIIIPSSQLAIS